MSEPVAQVPKRKPFKKQIYRGIEIDKLLEMDHKEVIAMFKSGQRRRVKHGMHPKYDRLVKNIKTFANSGTGLACVTLLPRKCTCAGSEHRLEPEVGCVLLEHLGRRHCRWHVLRFHLR